MTYATWDQIKNKGKNLNEAVNASPARLKRAWQEFKIICQEYSNNNGFVTRELENTLKSINKKRSEVMILDHGCGGGLISLYLIAIGYSGVHGVNVNDEVKNLNKIFETLGHSQQNKFFQIKGRELPFSDNTFDFIFSKQVLEHVNSADITIFYAEENRVGKNGATIFHELPHLFQPYDSHSRLFFAHWMPRLIQPFVYGVMKTIQNKKNCFRDGKLIAKRFNGDFLTLRSPFFHYKLSKKYFGNCVDVSESRLLQKIAVEDYDRDGVLFFRRIVSFLLNAPFAGRLFVRLLRYCFVISTISINQKH